MSYMIEPAADPPIGEDEPWEAPEEDPGPGPYRPTRNPWE